MTHRNWSEEWVTVLCPACARPSDWPHPELGCACGAVLRVPVRGPGYAEEPDGAGEADGAGGTGEPDGARGVDGADRSGGADGGYDGGDGYDRGDRGDRGGTDGAGDRGPLGGSASAADDARSAADDTAAPATPGSGAGAGSHDVPEGALRPAARSGTPAPAPAPTPAHSPVPDAEGDTDRDGYPSFTQRHPSPPHHTLPGAQAPALPVRPAFRPVTIRTARDAVAASAGYLRWLGFRDVVQPEERSAVAVDLRGPGLVAQVDPSTRPTGLRAVECLWLNGLSNGATSVCFSLAGYTPEAHERAEGLGIPLFVLDLTGTPQPVNAPADTLVDTGAA
ncbi:hypothetical protein ACWGI1_21880 [Streptomyces sp. NPDC054835]|uniref:hypothetical protein n=1 Tax=Streptomyces sp. NBC_01268 TaxID=2903806 RepID=UPI002E37C27B|nr:hypothetical protein [Streptomyces sp. NBC_01268]